MNNASSCPCLPLKPPLSSSSGSSRSSLSFCSSILPRSYPPRGLSTTLPRSGWLCCQMAGSFSSFRSCSNVPQNVNLPSKTTPSHSSCRLPGSPSLPLSEVSPCAQSLSAFSPPSCERQGPGTLFALFLAPPPHPGRY